MVLGQQFLILNPVLTDRVVDFEAFTRDVLAPAVQAHSPETSDKVQLWKASEPEPGADGITIYAFVADGVSSWDDLDLLPAFTAHYGEEEAKRHLETFGGFFADHRAWAASWAAAFGPEAEDEEGRQYGWQMQHLPMYPTAE